MYQLNVFYHRTDAENQLFNQEDGTFLIRDRKDKVGPPHACSLVYVYFYLIHVDVQYKHEYPGHAKSCTFNEANVNLSTQNITFLGILL